MINLELLQLVLKSDKNITFVGESLDEGYCLVYGNNKAGWNSVIPEEGLMSECLDWIRYQGGSVKRMDFGSCYMLIMPTYAILFDERDELKSIIKACEYIFSKIKD